MTSNISFFNIMKEDLRHRKWAAALSLISNLLALPVFLFLIQQIIASRGYYEIYEEEMHAFFLMRDCIEFFKKYALVSSLIVIFLIGLVNAVSGYSYLLNRKAADLFHSLPVKRSRLFLAHYLNGAILWIVPFLLSTTCALLLCFSSIGNSNYFTHVAVIAGKFVLLLILSFFVVYNLCILGVIISGNLLNTLISILILGLSVSISFVALENLAFFCLDTFVAFPKWTENFVLASPLVCAVMLPTTMLNGYSFSMLSDGSYYCIAFLLLITTFGAAWKLYIDRQSESAEQGIHEQRFQVILHFLGTFTITTLFLFLVFAITDANTLQTGLGFICSIFISIIVFGILNIIFHMNMRAFFAHKIQMIYTTTLIVLLFITMQYDLYDYDSRLPDKDEIASASIMIYNYSDTSISYMPVEPGILTYNYILNTPDNAKTACTDIDAIYEFLTTVTAAPSMRSGLSSTYTNVQVNLKDGSSYLRQYIIYENDFEILKPLVESEEYKKQNYRLSTGNLTIPRSILLSDTHQTMRMEDSDKITALMEAYTQDFNEHYSLETLENGIYILHLKLYYTTEYSDTSFTLFVFEEYANTLAYVSELYPEWILQKDKMEITSIVLSTEMHTALSEESIYSYYGLEGYPDYDDILSAYYESDEYYENINNMSDYSYLSSNNYLLSLTGEDDVNELLPLLHIGSYSTSYNPASTDYVYTGNVITSSGRSYSCYIESGKMPVEWIDELINSSGQ